MSVMIFAAWAVLLSGPFVRYSNAFEEGWQLAEVGSPQPSSRINWPDPPPSSCKYAKAVENRTVVRLLDDLEVLCDTKIDGGGWLVFQRRLSPDVDFNRNWTDYKDGFGNIRGNFWLKNEKNHRLTFLRRHELRVDLTFNGSSCFAQYSKFRIFGEAEKYTIEVGGYSRNAGDCLAYHNGMAFSTRDRDNDPHNMHCAAYYRSVWWFRSCYGSNLN